MKKPVVLTATLAILIAPALMGTGYRLAPVLPEVRTHLDSAQQFLDSGNAAKAHAHASVVLVAEEIKVSVNYEGIDQADRGRCDDALEGAFETWQTALGGQIIFKRVDGAQPGDVLVRFRPDVRMGREAVAGFVNWRRTVRTEGAKVLEASYSANMQLRTRNLDGRAMTLSAMHHEACHELGHVLGLDDQDQVGTLMGPLDPDRPVRGPSDAEADAVQELREEARNLLKKADLLATK